MAPDQNNPPEANNPRIGASRSSEGTAERMSDADDMGLLARIQSGDETAMPALFDRYGKLVYSVAFRVLKDASEAEDVMQEIFVQVWTNPRAFVSGKGSLAGWLAVVARNRSIDVIRRRRPAEPVELFALPAATNVALEAERDSLLGKIRGVMSGLPEEQRRPLELAFFEGLTHSEIAEKTGDPLGTVKTRIRMALTTIRKALAV